MISTKELIAAARLTKHLLDNNGVVGASGAAELFGELADRLEAQAAPVEGMTLETTEEERTRFARYSARKEVNLSGNLMGRFLRDFGRLASALAAKEQERARSDDTVQELGLRLREEQKRNERLAGALREAEDAAKGASSTLDAWFDRRELASSQIDAEVLEAARGYLRTSKNGGMSTKQADQVEAVIADMVRLSMFADLFARAALSQEKQP